MAGGREISYSRYLTDLGEHTELRNDGIMVADCAPHRPASETMARDYMQWLHPEKSWNYQLPADTIQIGTVRTRSSDSLVTDSAAAATAYACGIKVSVV